MALELILAMAVSAAASPPGREPMRAPLWRGVREVTLACDLEPEAALPSGFCAAALAEAGRDAPYPVRAADGSGGIATLALRLTAAARDGRTVLTVAGERASSIDESQGALLPRSTSAALGEPVKSTLARAFDDALPWRRARRVPSPPRLH